MRRITVRGGSSFARRLGVAISANLVLFWLVLGDSVFEVVLFGVLGGLAGALLTAKLAPIRDSGMRPAPQR
jgi:hypothetical protein